MNNQNARRPLKTRDVKIINTFARYLSNKNIKPNQISVMSVLFAGLSAGCFLFYIKNPVWWLIILAAIFIQCRLLCNLFDGLVAIEGGKSTKSGELFNDFPDRIADSLILVSAGYSIHAVSHGGDLGWCAALLSVMTAYVRTLVASIGAPVNFTGPMAKQHRMALLTFACILAAIETSYWNSNHTIFYALILISAGCIITCVRRAISAYRFLET